MKPSGERHDENQAAIYRPGERCAEERAAIY
jgi:hypothetical protein